MSIALLGELKKLREQVNILTAAVFDLQTRIKELESVEEAPLPGEEPLKRGPGRPRKVAQ